MPVTKTERTAQLELTMNNSTEGIATRTLSFPTAFQSFAEASPKFLAMKSKLLSDYKYVIQPSNWRDSDYGEEAYELTDVNFKLVQKTTTEFD